MYEQYLLGQGSHRYELKVMCAIKGAKTLQQLFYSKNPHLDGTLGFSNKKKKHNGPTKKYHLSGILLNSINSHTHDLLLHSAKQKTCTYW